MLTDMLIEMIKGFTDVFMISETKFDNSFPGVKFFTEGYHTPFRFDRNGISGGILLYVEINLHKKK